jgi:hypothetical protein
VLAAQSVAIPRGRVSRATGGEPGNLSLENPGVVFKEPAPGTGHVMAFLRELAHALLAGPLSAKKPAGSTDSQHLPVTGEDHG